MPNKGRIKRLREVKDELRKAIDVIEEFEYPLNIFNNASLALERLTEARGHIGNIIGELEKTGR